MPPKEPFTQSFPYIIHKLHRLVHLHINRAFSRSGHDISFEQFLVLVFLWEREGRSQQELAELTFKDKSSITRLIDGLARRGLVKGVTGPDDRRSKRILLTEKGRQIQPGCYADGQRHRKRLMDGITPEELNTTRQTLLKMIENLQSKSSGEE